MEIVRLRSVNQNLEKKNKELLSKLDELTKKNNLLSKENISLKYSHKEPQKFIINNNISNNYISDKNKIIEELNKKILKISNEKNELEKNNKKLKNINNDLIQEKNDLEKKLLKYTKDLEILNRNMKEMSEIKDNYREKYQRIEKELINEKQKNKILEKKLDDDNDNYNMNINIFNNDLIVDESKTQTYKNHKLNKVSEIEIEKLTKLSKGAHQSPQYTHKSISRFSTDNTYSTKKIYNNIDDLEISPENYNIVKEFRINNLKWFLFKKINKNILSETEGIQPLYRRYQYLKLNSSRKKEKEKINGDSYSNYIWKAYKEEKDFINFNLDNLDPNDIIENEKDKKINELKMAIKELKENLVKKENDYNRINLDYAKLFKKSKKPGMTYDGILEENEKLKNENKLLNKKLEKILETQNFIGISFIGDDLDGSKFIDDNAFEDILEEVTKNRENKKEKEIITMKCFISNEDYKNKENIKQEQYINNNKINNSNENIDEKKIKYKDTELEIGLNNKNKKILKKEFIKDILSRSKKSNDKNLIEKEKEDNKTKTNKKEKDNDINIYEKIKKHSYYKRYHKSINNTRNINTETDIKNEKINLKESSIYKKIYQQSFNLDSTNKSINKDKNNLKSEEKKENQRRFGFFNRRKYLKEKQEKYTKSVENK